MSYSQYIFSDPVHSGTYAAEISDYGYGADPLGQTVTDTGGQTYTLSFWYWQNLSVPNGIDVTWNGVSVHSRVNELVAGYQHVAVTVVGAGSDDLLFTAYNPHGTFLDDVSLNIQVPEPAGWALMITGFAAIGAASRSRRRGIA